MITRSGADEKKGEVASTTERRLPDQMRPKPSASRRPPFAADFVVPHEVKNVQRQEIYRRPIYERRGKAASNAPTATAAARTEGREDCWQKFNWGGSSSTTGIGLTRVIRPFSCCQDPAGKREGMVQGRLTMGERRVAWVSLPSLGGGSTGRDGPCRGCFYNITVT